LIRTHPSSCLKQRRDRPHGIRKLLIIILFRDFPTLGFETVLSKTGPSVSYNSIWSMVTHTLGSGTQLGS
jgi:hypothetical protein